MMITEIVGFFLIALSGVAEGMMDTLQFRFFSSRFSNLDWQFWNPAVSWKNKWANADFGFRKPKFWGSTGIFVFLTDGWHMMKFIRNVLMWGGILCLAGLTWKMTLVVGLSRIVYGGLFNLTYNKICKK